MHVWLSSSLSVVAIVLHKMLMCTCMRVRYSHVLLAQYSSQTDGGFISFLVAQVQRSLLTNNLGRLCARSPTEKKGMTDLPKAYMSLTLDLRTTMVEM